MSPMEGYRLEDLKELEETRFIDGSKYKGTWDALGMEGTGRYVLPHNIAYEGEFRDGTFHGNGSAYWPRGQRIDSIWLQGRSIIGRYVFKDDLVFFKDGWKYCVFPDRRFQECLQNGLRPAGATMKTSRLRTKAVPPTCLDAGNGIFDPRTGCVTSYRDSRKVVEIPTSAKARWIEENCRRGWTEPTGHRPDLYENWFSPTIQSNLFPPDFLPFSKNSFDYWWKRLPTFQRDRNLKVESDQNVCGCV